MMAIVTLHKLTHKKQTSQLGSRPGGEMPVINSHSAVKLSRAHAHTSFKMKMT